MIGRLRGVFARPALGVRGERFAARYLQRRGYSILHRNLTRGRDEADLVALDPDGRTVVIVEVKTSAGGGYAPEARVDRGKRRALTRLGWRLVADARYRDRPFRFDVVAVEWPTGSRPTVRHVVGAFEAE